MGSAHDAWIENEDGKRLVRINRDGNKCRPGCCHFFHVKKGLEAATYQMKDGDGERANAIGPKSLAL